MIFSESFLRRKGKEMKAKVLLRNIGILLMVLAVGLTAYAFIMDKSGLGSDDKELVNATEETSSTEKTQEPTAKATEKLPENTEATKITEEPSKTTELPSEDKSESENNADSSENQENQEVSTMAPTAAPSSDATVTELPADESGENQIVAYTLQVTKGMSATQIANRLEANGIIKNASEFTEVMVSKGVTNDINVGSYEFNSDSTYDQIISALTGKQK